MADRDNDPKALTRRWFEEIWNQGREATIDELADPACRFHGLTDTGQPLVGPDEFRQFYRRFRGAWSDLHVSIEDMLQDGEKVCVRLSFTGRHTGDTLGLAPTNRPVRGTAMCIAQWHDGRLTEGWNEIDMARVIAQLAPAR